MDVDVKNAAQLLDRLIKDVVTECENFDLDKFIPLLRYGSFVCARVFSRAVVDL